MALLSAKNVSFSYDKQKKVIDDFSLDIKKGEYIAIIGHNGSGKSTLAKLFNGLLKPDQGSLSVGGFSVFDKKNEFEIRKRVGVVFQNPDNQLVASIVEDDVAFGPENLGVPRKEIGERIEFALKSVGMEKYRHSSPNRLSGGQKQRIAIAGVLALNPEILVLDESTAMLDPKGRAEVLSVVKKLNKEKEVTVVSITHYMDEVVQADRVIVLSEGRIALSGTPEQIFSQSEILSNLGLELPLSTSIAKRLGIKDGVLNKEKLAEELCRLKLKI